MDSIETIRTIIRQQRILPLFYHDEAEVCDAVTRALYEAGIRAIEFTNRGKKALDNFRLLVSVRNDGMKDLKLGIGTIRSAKQANDFLDAGADFLVSPMFDADVCDAAYIRKTCWIPGCMTPTEIHQASMAGCELIKLFPGNVLGPGFVSAIRPLFPGVEFMPTGGVELKKKNIAAWFESGVVAVGMGSNLITKKALAEKNYKQITSDTKDVLKLLKKIK
jgi:2-dehydro-3-deoxyphosphogluconate aldolase/(4S)-4-hydroxy-2-oxoglutarate aldolase